MNIDVRQFLEAFLVEAAEHLEEFESTLLELERHPGERELLNTIFRCAHSIKGGAATFGLPDVAHFTHSLETLLDEVRNDKAALDPALLLRAVDQIRALLAVAKGEATSAPDGQALMDELGAAASNRPAASPVVAPTATEAAGTTTYRFRFKPSSDVMANGGDPLIPLAGLSELGEVSELICDTSRLPSLSNLDPIQSYLSWEGKLVTESNREEIDELFEFVAEPGDLVLLEEVVAVAATETAAATEPTVVRHDSAILRVPAEKLDRLVNLVGELVIAQSMLNAAMDGFTMDRMLTLSAAVASMDRTCREMQERVMSVRMVPVRQAFGRFPRLVRDLGLQTDKQVELVMSGEDTELDKTLIEAIVDPLTHLVRNAIDHGLETPEERKAAGKSGVGRLSIVARHEGGSVVIEVSDDGKGLDRDRILAKAIAKNLLPADGPTPSDETIFGMIFQPGFSTAAAVTDLSGRGVGMDIVRSAIADLNGTVSVSTEAGKGSQFRIRLPLTMAIMECLSLRIGAETYVLQLTSIVESIRPLRSAIRTINGHQEVVRVREDILPILRLHRFFGIGEAIEDPCEALLVIVESEGTRIALLVDELVGQSQAVVKSLEANYRKVDGVAGATILGDGTVALILDVAGLVQGASAFGELVA